MPIKDLRDGKIECCTFTDFFEKSRLKILQEKCNLQLIWFYDNASIR